MSAARPAMRGIVCVGFADWDTELWTNQQHLMSRLAERGEVVLFIESLGLRRPQLRGKDARRIARRLSRGLRPPRRRGGVTVLSPLVIPLHGSRPVRAVNARLLRRTVRRAARRLGLEHPVLWSYVPQAEPLIEALEPSLVVYHCVDDIAEQPGVASAPFRAVEKRFVARADLVLTSAPALDARMRTLTPKVLYAPNVADTALFATALDDGPVDPAIAALPRPRLVFTGAVVATKVDVELLAEVARRRPDWTLALVGPVGAGDPGTDLSALDGLPNVHLLGARPYAGLPAVLRGADAALIPYLINPLTRSVLPMKVHEYLAAGLPVVATPLPALEGQTDIVFASTAEETVDAVGAALAQDTPELRRERSRRAAAHSWDSRIEEILAALPPGPAT